MLNSIIQVSDLSKSYTISHEGHGKHDTLRDVMARRANKIFSFSGWRPDAGITKEEFWALKDINFEIERGDRVGIIGRNGAGKSTLLKILSRITEPTTGSVKIKGRVASLLEVGTGFHPELSGRENIFLNGAILGMSREEIKRHFDAIVEFAEIEKFLDTPVKRYSSGMYVRLAFAVAAHLEPEILIVDEVLAVGDAQFQQKCLGKMEDVSKNEGRTVLFVSHNMTAVNSFCTSCIYLKNGAIKLIGNSKDVIDNYISVESKLRGTIQFSGTNFPGDRIAVLHDARLINSESKTVDSAYLDQKLGVEINYEVLVAGFFPVPNIHVRSSKGELLFVSAAPAEKHFSNPGKHKAIVWIPANLLNENKYTVDVALSTLSPEIVHFNAREALIFEVLENMNNRLNNLSGKMPGLFRPNLAWLTS